MLAFLTAGRVALLSDQDGSGWMYDYRSLQAVQEAGRRLRRWGRVDRDLARGKLGLRAR